ncbi:MAG: hypothetical protein M3Q71_18090 [Chloroflexota bacterium]|nr:hypothetical protein [Chloroflexota bacterium]
MRSPLALLSSLLLLLLGTLPLAAQEATPAAAPMPGDPTGGQPVVASGLTNPRGMT